MTSVDCAPSHSHVQGRETHEKGELGSNVSGKTHDVLYLCGSGLPLVSGCRKKESEGEGEGERE